MGRRSKYGIEEKAEAVNNYKRGKEEQCKYAKI